MIDAFCNLEQFEGEEPWCDLTFEVTSARKSLFSRATTFWIEADVNGKPIGLIVRSNPKDWKPATAEDDAPAGFWWGKLSLHSVGQNSDNLLALWRDYFSLPGRTTFAKRIDCNAVSLEGDPTRMADGVVRTKLFFDSGEQADDLDNYAELYFNVDARQGFAALHEKDPDYREPLIAWCSGVYGNA